MTYEAQFYRSPIHLPAQRVGRMEIRHRTIRKGGEVLVVGMRQAALRGVRPVKSRVEKTLRIHELVEHGRRGQSLWMTDLPEELNQIGEMLRKVRPRGRVLIGGLGLGILASCALRILGKTYRGYTYHPEGKDIDQSEPTLEIWLGLEYED